MSPSLLMSSALAVVVVTAASAQARPREAARTERSSAESPGSKDEGAQASEKESRSPATTLFWIDSGVGWQRVGLTTLHVQRDSSGNAVSGELAPAVLDGPTASLALGVRWLVVTVGARATAAYFNESTADRPGNQFYSVDAELGLRIPAGRLEPRIEFGAGYSVFGRPVDAVTGVGEGLNVDGGNLRLALGLDYFLSRTWSIGARATGELLFLARSGVPIRDLARAESVATVREAKTRLLDGDGTSAGSALSVWIGPGLHF